MLQLIDELDNPQADANNSLLVMAKYGIENFCNECVLL